jgi:DNA-binding response OmpR family regulator
MVPKALVVDDDTMILDLLEKVLTREGYDIIRATGGEQAVKVLDAEIFDLVITDLQMGNSSGFDVIRKAKSVAGQTKVIMITGCSDSSSRADAYRYGADDFLQKPFSLSDLFEHIEPQG